MAPNLKESLIAWTIVVVLIGVLVAAALLVDSCFLCEMD
jgi:hypothetical protein